MAATISASAAQNLRGAAHMVAGVLLFAVMDAMRQTLALIPGLEVEVVDSGCCGMAGAFGYEAEHYDLSLRMAELDLLPAVRAAADDVLLVANGFSCRHQIADGAARDARRQAQADQGGPGQGAPRRGRGRAHGTSLGAVIRARRCRRRRRRAPRGSSRRKSHRPSQRR